MGIVEMLRRVWASQVSRKRPARRRRPRWLRRYLLQMETLEDRLAPSAGKMYLLATTMPPGNPADTVYPYQQLTATVQLNSTTNSTLDEYDIGISYDRNVLQTPADGSGLSTPADASRAGFFGVSGTVLSPNPFLGGTLNTVTADNYEIGSYSMSNTATLNLLNILYTVQPNAAAGPSVINLRQYTQFANAHWLPTDAHGTTGYWTLNPQVSDVGDGTDPNDLTLTVGTIGAAAVTSNSVTSSTNASAFGQSVTFTATITGTDGTAHPTFGGVEFLDGATVLGYANVTASGTDGIATLTTSALSRGTHTITAVFGGDTNFTGSTSGNFIQTVNQAATTTTVTCATNPSARSGRYLHRYCEHYLTGCGHTYRHRYLQ